MILDRNMKIICMQCCIHAYETSEEKTKFPFLDNIEYFTSIFIKTFFFKRKSIRYNVEGFFGERNNQLFITFRGTDSGTDWLSNSKFWKTNTPTYFRKNKKLWNNPKIKIHAGFAEQYKAIFPTIINKVKHHDNKGIIISGHSLGGALATICAYDLSLNYPEKEITVFSAGSPRVGNHYFSMSFKENINDHYRLMNRFDIVPTVPRIWMGFNHTKTGEFVEKRTWKFRLLHPISWIRSKIGDHDTQEYLRKI